MRDTTPNMEYVRQLYADVLDWYKSADSKAQVALAINGGFLAFLTGTIFSDPERLRAIFTQFNWITWSLLALMVLSLLGSVGMALYCLWSRTYSLKEVRQLVNKAELEKSTSGTYPPGAIMWFFQLIEGLDRQKFQATLETVGREFELKTLGKEIYVLSKHVRKKHFAVNVAFVLVTINLILFLAAGISYIVTIALTLP